MSSTPPENLSKFSTAHALERHMQTLLLTIVSALLIWNYTVTQSAQVDLAALRAQTELMRADVGRLQVSLEQISAQRYTPTDASAARAEMLASIAQLDNRVRDLERAR
jgi:hypothetical protein